MWCIVVKLSVILTVYTSCSSYDTHCKELPAVIWTQFAFSHFISLILAFVIIWLWCRNAFYISLYKALNGLLCADVPLRNYSLIDSVARSRLLHSCRSLSITSAACRGPFLCLFLHMRWAAALMKWAQQSLTVVFCLACFCWTTAREMFKYDVTEHQLNAKRTDWRSGNEKLTTTVLGNDHRPALTVATSLRKWSITDMSQACRWQIVKNSHTGILWSCVTIA